MPDVVIRLDEKKVRRFVDLHQANPEMSWLAKDLADDLRAALDSPPVEEGSEYRVVEERDGQLVERYGGEDCVEREEAARLAEVRRQAEHLRHFAITNVRVQQRTITTFADGSSLIGPWSEGER